MTSSTFPERLRLKRKERKLTQADIAARTRVSPQAVSQWENGLTNATHENVLALAEVLGVDWEWLGYDGKVADPDNPISDLALFNSLECQAPYCSHNDILEWAEKFPSLDVDTWSYFDLKLRDKPVEPRYEVFGSRFKSMSVLLVTSVEDGSMLPEISEDDILLFDTGLQPVPGDIVIAIIITNSEKNVVIRRLRKFTGSDRTIYNELLPINKDFATTVLHGQEEGRLLGTLAEIHRFRKRSAGDTRAPLHLARTWADMVEEQATDAASSDA